MHLHQTHRGSQVPTPENGEHSFLIIIFWWFGCLQLTQICLFTLARRATCQRPGGTGRLSSRLTPGQPLTWPWSRAVFCGKDAARGNLAVGQHSWCNSSPPRATPLRGVWTQVACLKCSFLVPFMSPCIYISKQGHYPFFRFTFQ